MSWIVTENRHVIPKDDLRPHVETENCWCQPAEDEGIVIHNSADLREQFETGERKVS